MCFSGSVMTDACFQPLFLLLFLLSEEGICCFCDWILRISSISACVGPQVLPPAESWFPANYIHIVTPLFHKSVLSSFNVYQKQIKLISDEKWKKTFLAWCHFPGVRTRAFLQDGAAEQSLHSVGERRGSLWETATDFHPHSTEEMHGERLLSLGFSWGLFWTETQTPGGDAACCCSLDKRPSQWDVQPPGLQK